MSSDIILPEEELPQWMKQARRAPDYGFWLVLGFSLLLAWSFLLNPSLPATNASEHHIFRAQEMAEAFTAGNWYPRWSPSISQGLGAPLPHYTPPGSSYASGLLTFLATADPTLSVRLLYVMAFLLAGSTTYLLVKNHVNGRSGVIAMLLYLYSPYVGQTVPHTLGDLPQMLALALMPTVLWSLHRLLTRNLPLDVTILTLTSAALMWTSPPYFAITLLLGVVLTAINWRNTQTRKRLLLIILSIECGIFITANFWFPFIWEVDLVQWFPHPFAMPDYQVLWSDLLSRHIPPDPAFHIMAPQWRLGWPLLIFGISAYLILLTRRHLRGTMQAGMLLIGIILIMLLIWVFPNQTWLLGVIVFCLSIGGSLIVHPAIRLNRIAQRLLFVSATVIVLGLSASVWFTIQQTTPSALDYASPYDYEANQFGVLGLPVGYRLPSTLANPYQPTITPEIINEEPQRLIELDDNGVPRLSRVSAHQFEYTMPQLDEQPLQVLLADFAGWSASIEGERLQLNPSDQDGVIIVQLQAEEGDTLLLHLGTTPARMLGWLLSYGALFALLIVSWRRWLMREPAFDESLLLQRWESRYLGLVLALLIGVIILKNYSDVLNNYETIRGSNLLLTERLEVDTSSNEMSLVGINLSSHIWQRNRPTYALFHWRINQPPRYDYLLQLELYDPVSERSWVVSEARLLANYPTRRIPSETFIEDRIDIVWPIDLPAGGYTLEMQVLLCELDCENAEPLTLFSEADSNGTTHYPLRESLRIN